MAMAPETREALREVLFSPRRCTDPAGALADASEELDFEVTVGTLDGLSDDEGERLLHHLEDLYPDRTERIIAAAVHWARCL